MHRPSGRGLGRCIGPDSFHPPLPPEAGEGDQGGEGVQISSAPGPGKSRARRVNCKPGKETKEGTIEALRTAARKLGLELTSAQLELFELYYQELVAWNRRVNLTAITAYREVQRKHFLDSLTVAWALGLDLTGWQTLDVGSGGGFPGVPLKIVYPGMSLTLLEATAKKARFLEHLAHTLGLNEVEVITGRAEDVAHRETFRERFDLVLTRALAPLPVAAELALPFVRLAGRWVAQVKGKTEPMPEAIPLLGGRIAAIKEVPEELLEGQRRLLLIEKIASTPPGYPRRPGIPAKRPLT